MGDFILLGFSYGLSTIEWLDRSQVSFFPFSFGLLRAKKKKERRRESELPVLERVGWVRGNEILLVGDGI